MKKLIAIACLAFLGSAAFGQDTKTMGEKKETKKMKTEHQTQAPGGGKDKVEVKQDKKINTKDKGDVIDKTETTKRVKHTVKHKAHHKDSTAVRK